LLQVLVSNSPPTTLFLATYGRDTNGRLNSVSSGIYSATYVYLANSDLLQTTACKSNTTAVLTTTRTWETGPRLKSIVNTANGVPVTSHEYAYDSLASVSPEWPLNKA
jgi:hypothetical protein